MRRAVVFGLLIFVVIVIAATGITWFFQAAGARRAVEQAIAAVNQQQAFITYDAIETTGFPHKVTVSIVNPRFSGRIDEHYKHLFTKEWHEDIALKGRISFGINALSDRYDMTTNGEWTIVSRVNGQTLHTVSHPQGDTVCILQLGNGGMFGRLWNFSALTGIQDIVQDFRRLDCRAPASTATDPATQAALATNGPLRLLVTNAPANGRTKFSFLLNGSLEVTQAGDAVFSRYEQVFGAAPSSIPGELSAYGRQEIDIDLAYDGPLAPQGKLIDTPFDIRLNRFILNNAAYVSSLTFQAANTVSGESRELHTTFRADSTVSERYDALVRNLWRNVIAELYASTDPNMAMLRPTLQKYTPEELFTIASPAIPNFYTLGKTVAAWDAGYKGNAAFTNGTATLSALEISFAPYGITGKGSVSIAPDRLFPSGGLTLICTNCLRLVDDGFAYAMRVHSVAKQLMPEDEGDMLNPKLGDGIKAFLIALVQPAAGTDFTYALASDGAGSFTLNGKGFDEVMALYGQHIAPFLQASAAEDAETKTKTKAP